MARQQYPQVYGPNGRWVGSFYTWEDAERWIRDRGGYEITYRRPTPEELGRTTASA